MKDFNRRIPMLREVLDAHVKHGDYAIWIHTFIVGQPYRLARLRRALQHMLSHADVTWVTLPKDSASYYTALPSDIQLSAQSATLDA